MAVEGGWKWVYRLFWRRVCRCLVGAGVHLGDGSCTHRLSLLIISRLSPEERPVSPHIPASTGLVLALEYPNRIKGPFLHQSIDGDGPCRPRADNRDAFSWHLSDCNLLSDTAKLQNCPAQLSVGCPNLKYSAESRHRSFIHAMACKAQ